MNYVGLYSGCGGADLGFHQNGFHNIGSFDNNSVALEVLKTNLSAPTFCVDLLSTDVYSILDKQNVDVTFSGAPCQGFSTAGNRVFNDPRNNLLVRGGEIALGLNTQVFISENVMGSFAGRHKEYWERLELLFKKNGYKTEFIKVNCLDIGMAQMRKRVLFFAWRTKASQIRWPDKVPSKNLGTTLEDLVSAPDNDGIILKDADKTAQIAAHIKPKQKLSNVRGGRRAVAMWDIPEIFGPVSDLERDILMSIRSLRRRIRRRTNGDADPVDIEILANLYGEKISGILESLEARGYIRYPEKNRVDLTKTFNGKYRRLSWDEPCPTVDTRFGNPTYFLHPEEPRGFTVREAARIQGFPDSFEFIGSLQEKYRMIGNAVPPPLSFIISDIVKKQLLN